jgi:hypothetical protein
MQIEAEVTVLDLDEALAHVAAQLKIDEYGERMNWRKKEILLSSIDDLLDARLELLSRTDKHSKIELCLGTN